MLKVIGIIALGAIISIIEVPKMSKQNLKKEIALYMILLASGLLLLSLISLDVEITSLSEIIENILNPVDKLFTKCYGNMEGGIIIQWKR